MDQVKEFCAKAKEKQITFKSMVGCINKIQSGRMMSKKEQKASDFLGEPNTFWNPVEHLDYNWFLNHNAEIKAELETDQTKIKPVTPRIPPQTVEWLGEVFKNPTKGSGYSIEAFRSLYVRALHDLRGRFDKGELSLMIDVFNGTMLTPQLAGQQLIIQCVDGMDLDGLDEKWNIDREAFTEKLNALTLTEATALEIWANGFWYGGPSETAGELPDFDEYVSTLLRQATNEGGTK